MVLAYLTQRDPTRTHAYAAYGADLARSKSLKARKYAERAGVQTSGTFREWRTPEGGGLLASSIGGTLTGHGVDGLAVVDDPVKNKVEAESKNRRDAIHGWFTDVLETRLEPSSSVIVTMTRWHPDDLAGRLIADGGWEHINLEAICETLDDPNGRALGEALWSERWPIEELQKKKKRAPEHTWLALFQGRPRKRGGSVFRGAASYQQLPSTMRLVIGLDLAYTEDTQADYSVAVLMAECDGKYFILDVLRDQVEVDVFAKQLKALRDAHYPPPPIVWYTGGTEVAIAKLLRKEGVRIITRRAVGDKFTRAQPASVEWNRGNIVVPAVESEWLDAFIEEVLGFTGVSDANDDQVDALAAAFDYLAPAARPAEDEALPDFGPGLHRDHDLPE